MTFQGAVNYLRFMLVFASISLKMCLAWGGGVTLFTMLLHSINIYIAKKLPNINTNGLEHCNMETCAYIWLTAIDDMLVVG